MKLKTIMIAMSILLFACLAQALEEEDAYLDPVISENTQRKLMKAEKLCIKPKEEKADLTYLTFGEKDCVYKEFARAIVEDHRDEIANTTFPAMKKCKDDAHGNAVTMDRCFQKIIVKKAQEISGACREIHKLKRYSRFSDDYQDCLSWVLQLLDQSQAQFFEERIGNAENPLKKISMGFIPAIIIITVIYFVTREKF